MTIPRELRLRPVVAFDVDGVLRVRKYEPRIGSADVSQYHSEQVLFSSEITMSQNEYPTLFHGKPRWDEQGKSTHTEHFSVAGAELIRSIVEGQTAEAVWATTWQRWANSYFAEPLGIPEIPVAVVSLEENYFHCSPSWKTYQLSRQFDGRPLIWLDDNMPDRPGEDLAGQRRPIDRALTLSYRVNPFTGITPEDVEAIDSWLQLASTPEGQAELRAKHAQELKDQRAYWAKDRRRRDREHAIFERTLPLAEDLFPGQEYFTRELARMAMNREGLTAENIGYALKRNSISADPREIFSKLRVRGYHRKESRPDQWDEDPIDSDF